MRDDPGLDVSAIAACLESHYGIRVASIAYLPIGYDLSASVYEVVAADGTRYFLKLWSGPVTETSLLIQRALIDCGIRNVLAPQPTRESAVWSPLDGPAGYSVVLHPFIRGESAMVAGMSDDQWRQFGATLRAIHDSGLGQTFRGRIRSETFALPSATLVRRLLAHIDRLEFESAAATRFAEFWRANDGQIQRMLTRVEELGKSLRTKTFELVLCHGDIHAANILVGDDGRIWLIDWDSPLIAPRERDLLFVVGSRIARPVEFREETLFFEGYGAIEIDSNALIYYRYERIIEDLGEFAESVFMDPDLSEHAREDQVNLATSFFAPDGDIDRAEIVDRTRCPNASV